MKIMLAAVISLLPVCALAQTTGMRPGPARVITGTTTTNTATTADYNGTIVWRSTGSGVKTQTLPACNASANGMKIGVVDGQNTAAAANINVVAPSGSSIVGPATSITANRGSLEATCDGTSTWIVTSNNNLPGTGGGGGAPAGEVAWRVVLPSGGDDTDMINQALETSTQGVILDGGVFNSCRTITVPRDHVLSGTRTGLYYSGAGPSPWGYWPGTASIRCPNWSTAQYTGLDPNNRDDAAPTSAMVFMRANAVVEGFAIYGPSPGGGHEWAGEWSGGICLSGTSSMGARIRFMLLGFCRIGASFMGSSAYPFDSIGGMAQEMEFTGDTFWWDTFDIVFGSDRTGNGSPDWRVIDNEFAVPYGIAILCDVCSHGMIQNNRIEDGYGGILLSRSHLIQIQNNFFNNMQWPIDLGGDRPDSLWGSIVSGNQAQQQFAMQEACWFITGPMGGDTFMGNQCQYGYAGAWMLDGSHAYVEDILLLDHPYPGLMPLFRHRRTQDAMKKWEVLHYLPTSPWATDPSWYCCGVPTSYVPNPGNP